MAYGTLFPRFGGFRQTLRRLNQNSPKGGDFTVEVDSPVSVTKGPEKGEGPEGSPLQEANPGKRENPALLSQMAPGAQRSRKCPANEMDLCWFGGLKTMCVHFLYYPSWQPSPHILWRIRIYHLHLSSRSHSYSHRTCKQVPVRNAISGDPPSSQPPFPATSLLLPLLPLGFWGLPFL